MKSEMKHRFQVVCAMVIVCWSVYAGAQQNYYISTTGTDTGNCQITPCKTFAYVEEQAGPGAVINIAAGTYRLTTGSPGNYTSTGGRIVPQDSQTFTGPACTPTVAKCTAILSGSVQLTQAQILGPDSFGNYYATGFTQQGGQFPYSCDTGWDGCYFAEDLYVNGAPYQHINLPSEQTLAAGKWWMNYTTDTIYLPAALTPGFVNANTVEISVLETAFFAPSGAKDVTVQNLTIEEFAAQNQQGGGIDPSYGQTSSPTFSQGWTVQKNYATLNHSNGIRVSYGMNVLNNVSTMNGQLGIGGGVPAAYNDDDTITPSGVSVQGNTVTANNYSHISPGFGAGGIKFGNTADAVVRGNTVSNNLGNGIHFDVNSWNPLVDGNTVANNLDPAGSSGTGIVCEISEGGCTIRNNVVTFEGKGGTYGLQSSTSVGGQLYCNVVTETANNNSLWIVNGSNRGPNTVWPYKGQETLSTGNAVHHNNFFWSAGQSGHVGYYLKVFPNSSIVETGTTVVVTVPLTVVPSVGSYIRINGATPAGFNGVWQITATTSSPVTYTFENAPPGLGTATVNGTSADQPNFFPLNAPPDYNAYHASSTTGKWFVYDNNNSGSNASLPFNNANPSYQGNGADIHGTFDTTYKSGFPAVSITSPADQSTVTPPVTIDATASDKTPFTISQVSFYDFTTPQNPVLLGTVQNAPYDFTWSHPSVGTHTVAAMASSTSGINRCWAITVNVN